MNILLHSAIAFSASLLTFHANAQAGSFVELVTQGEERLAVTGPALSMRIGNGVLLRGFSWKVSGSLATSGRLLASCRGLWISDFFDGDVHEAKGRWDLALWQRDARGREVEILSFPIGLGSWATSELTISTPLRSKIEGICRSSSAEPRNLYLPVSSAVPDKSGVIRVSAIVTGTAVRKENVIDVWLRTTEFVTETIKVNNEPFIVDGVEQKRRVANGNYEMKRSTYDCKNRQIGASQVVYYKSDGTNSTDSIDRTRLRLSDVTPNSVGEAELDAVCMLYGPLNP